MKKVFTISLLILFAVCNSVEAQENSDIYILDGTNTSFAWGRHVSFDKIAVGLGNEGVFELRGDTAVVFVDSSGKPDEQIFGISTDLMTGNKVFEIRHSLGGRFVTVDTLGRYSPELLYVFDRNGKTRGKIDPSGRIVSPKRKTHIRFNPDNVDRTLIAFFFLHQYVPRMPVEARDSE